jgi:hypothetical protein
VARNVKSNKGFKPVYGNIFSGKIDGSQGLFSPPKHRYVAWQNLLKNRCLVGDFLVVEVYPALLDGPATRGNTGF